MSGYERGRVARTAFFASGLDTHHLYLLPSPSCSNLQIVLGGFSLLLESICQLWVSKRLSPELIATESTAPFKKQIPIRSLHLSDLLPARASFTIPPGQ